MGRFPGPSNKKALRDQTYPKGFRRPEILGQDFSPIVFLLLLPKAAKRRALSLVNYNAGKIILSKEERQGEFSKGSFITSGEGSRLRKSSGPSPPSSGLPIG